MSVIPALERIRVLLGNPSQNGTYTVNAEDLKVLIEEIDQLREQQLGNIAFTRRIAQEGELNGQEMGDVEEKRLMAHEAEKSFERVFLK